MKMSPEQSAAAATSQAPSKRRRSAASPDAAMLDGTRTPRKRVAKAEKIVVEPTRRSTRVRNNALGVKAVEVNADALGWKFDMVVEYMDSVFESSCASDAVQVLDRRQQRHGQHDARAVSLTFAPADGLPATVHLAHDGLTAQGAAQRAGLDALKAMSLAGAEPTRPQLCSAVLGLLGGSSKDLLKALRTADAAQLVQHLEVIGLAARKAYVEDAFGSFVRFAKQSNIRVASLNDDGDDDDGAAPVAAAPVVSVDDVARMLKTVTEMAVVPPRGAKARPDTGSVSSQLTFLERDAQLLNDLRARLQRKVERQSRFMTKHNALLESMADLSMRFSRGASGARRSPDLSQYGLDKLLQVVPHHASSDVKALYNRLGLPHDFSKRAALDPSNAKHNAHAHTLYQMIDSHVFEQLNMADDGAVAEMDVVFLHRLVNALVGLAAKKHMPEHVAALASVGRAFVLRAMEQGRLVPPRAGPVVQPTEKALAVELGKAAAAAVASKRRSASA